MRILLNTASLSDYGRFLQIKRLPSYSFTGRTAVFPDEYRNRLGVDEPQEQSTPYMPIEGLFDYQEAITALAIQKQKFAIFADCGLGKTFMFLEYARHVANMLPASCCVLIVSPLMVIKQTLEECRRFCGDLHIEQLHAANLPEWLQAGDQRIGITNYDALKENTPRGRLGGLILDESGMLKSHYGKWGGICKRLGQGLEWKLCCTGTPAPNDRIEYANHAVFLDAYPTVNAFLSRFFVNRGQTDNRWEIKPHALEPFYRHLSHWSIFLTNPATYGWKDNTEPLPPVHVHIHHVEMTKEQQVAACLQTGQLFANEIGGITGRSVLSQLAKGNYQGKPIATYKPKAIRDLLESWPDESTLIWCLYNAEQKLLAKTLPQAASITGATPFAERERLIDNFKAGRTKVLISKPKILGFGLNLHRATRQVFSGLQDSYESYYQAIKRSNRYGATKPLNVHIPITDIERPMIETVLAKADRVQADTDAQERLFRRLSQNGGSDGGL